MKDVFKIMGAISFLISLSMGADHKEGAGGVDAVQQGMAGLTTKGSEDDFDFPEVGGADPQPAGARTPASVTKPANTPPSVTTSGPTAWETACGFGGRLVRGVGTLLQQGYATASMLKCNATGVSADNFCNLILQEFLSFRQRTSQNDPRGFSLVYDSGGEQRELKVYDLQFGIVTRGYKKEEKERNFYDFVDAHITHDRDRHLQQQFEKRQPRIMWNPGEEGDENARKTLIYEAQYDNCDGKGTIVFVVVHAWRKTIKVL